MFQSFRLNNCRETTRSKYESSSLVSIRSQEEQDFILNLVHSKHNLSNNIWIGLTLQQNKLKWTDNITENYTNLDNSNPRNISGYECVVMQMVIPYGKWINEPCSQRNFVVCQKSQKWLFSYLQNTVIELRKSVDNISKQLENKSKLLDNSILELEKTNRKQELTEKMLETAETSLNKLRQQINESMPVGSIAYFTHTTAPLGWLKTNGQSVSRTTYANLFASIATTFGSGDGCTTFTLPDLRGEFIRGWSDGRDVDKSRNFGSFQLGSSIPFVEGINTNSIYSMGTGYLGAWLTSAGSTFDEGCSWVFSGQIRSGITFPNDSIENRVYFGDAPNKGVITAWNVLSGTRPRNVALLACIKY